MRHLFGRPITSHKNMSRAGCPRRRSLPLNECCGPWARISVGIHKLLGGIYSQSRESQHVRTEKIKSASELELRIALSVRIFLP